MTKAIQIIRVTFTAFALILLLVLLSACTGEGTFLGEANGLGGFPGTNEITLTGRVTDANTGKWLNDYLVIVFLNGREVGRKVSHLGKFIYSGHGVHDGLFDVRIENTYELTVADDFVYKTNYQPLIMNTPDEQRPDSHNIYKWFGDLAPGTIIRIEVPSKQIEYTIAIMNVPNAELAETVLNGPTMIDENGKITSLSESAPQEKVIVGNEKAAKSQKPVVSSTDVQWARPLTHFSGNRWQAWELYVRNQVPGMTWQQFSDEVVTHNQHLLQSGYVFQYNETYLLPTVTNNIAEN